MNIRIGYSRQVPQGGKQLTDPDYRNILKTLDVFPHLFANSGAKQISKPTIKTKIVWSTTATPKRRKKIVEDAEQIDESNKAEEEGKRD